MVTERSDHYKRILYAQRVQNVIKKKKNAFTKDSVQDFSINTAFAPQLRTQAKT